MPINTLPQQLTIFLSAHRLRLLQLAVVLGVLCSAFLLPLLSLEMVALLLAAVPPLLAVGTAIVRWPGLGMIAIVGGAVLVPFQIGTGTGSSVNAPMLIIVGLVGVWMLGMLTRQKPLRLYNRWTIIPLVALFSSVIISFLVGQLPWYSFANGAPLPAQLGGMSLFIFSGLAFLWVGHEVADVKWLRWSVWVLMVGAAVYFIGRIAPGSVGRFIGRLTPYGTAGSLFFTWSAVLAFSQAAFNRTLAARWRILLLSIAGMALYISIFQLRGWASGWIPTMAAIGVALWLGAPRLGIWAGIAAGAAVVYRLPSLLERFVFIGDNAYSLSTRLEAWQIVGEIASVNPILGLGPANYYWYTPFFPIRGYTVHFNSHSQYVDLFAQTGIVGLICFLWFFISIWLFGWRLRGRLEAGGFPFAYTVGVMGGIVGNLVAAGLGDWVLPFVYNVGFSGFRSSVLGWVFLGGLIVLDRVYPREEVQP